MTEILTESFCERCGTRYTFQTAAPKRARVGRLKVLSKGISNWVQSDEASLEEALADARSEAERSVSSQQLEAFHETFNFCMSCRQYTCSNCWNEPENRCLTCAPDLSREILPAPFPELEPHGPAMGGAALVLGAAAHEAHEPGPEAWPEVDLTRLEAVIGGANGATVTSSDNGALEGSTEAAQPADESGAVEEGPVPAVPPEAPRRPLVAPRSSVAASADEEQSAQAAEEAAAAAIASAASAPPGTTMAAPVPEPAIAAPLPEATEATEPAAPGAGAAPPDDATHERAAAAAAKTSLLLRKFRPGQSLDAELEAYEREAAASAAAAASVAAASAAAVSEPEPEPVAAPEPELPVAAQAPEPEPAAPVAEPVTERRDDRVEIPTWRIVAPDTTPDVPPAPAPAIAPPLPAGEPGAPQWPQAPAASAPQWPTSAAFLAAAEAPAARAQAALWAASSAAVAQKPGGIQSCTSCGLSLSSTARFCRRCGTRQG